LAGISRRIAEQIGLSKKECDLIERAAPLNDLGHMMAPTGLLSQAVVLGRAERAAIQQHTVMGYHLLSSGDSEFLNRAAKIALSHHEHFDGGGYPHGFRGRDIAHEARIVAVADIVDALLSDRPYRKAWSFDRVLTYLQSERGKRFDPNCVDAFLQHGEEILSPNDSELPELICS
jgi:HD-GYP domain-containing protein (c-di-GMP phosphodiesterase class II)